jgi:hypothetical protein
MTERLLEGDELEHGMAPGARLRSRLLYGFLGVGFFEIRLFASAARVEDLLFPPGPDSAPEPKNAQQNAQDAAQMVMTRLYVT